MKKTTVKTNLTSTTNTNTNMPTMTPTTATPTTPTQPRCTPCGRTFTRPAELRHHLKTDAAHPFCAPCDVGFVCEAGFLDHRRSKHAPTCAPCGTAFDAWDALEAHWRDAPAHVHPCCAVCSTGFEDVQLYSWHMDYTHASTSVPCAQCLGRRVPAADLAVHYRTSARHPTCTPCGLGFLDDEAYDEHTLSMHADAHCALCGVQYESPMALAAHVRRSRRHPRCAEAGCEEGFMDEEAYDDHHRVHHAPSNANTPLTIVTDTSLVTVSSKTPTRRTPAFNVGSEYDYFTATRLGAPRGPPLTPSEADLTDMAHTFVSPSPSPARPRHHPTLPDIRDCAAAEAAAQLECEQEAAARAQAGAAWAREEAHAWTDAEAEEEEGDITTSLSPADARGGGFLAVGQARRERMILPKIVLPGIMSIPTPPTPVRPLARARGRIISVGIAAGAKGEPVRTGRVAGLVPDSAISEFMLEAPPIGARARAEVLRMSFGGDKEGDVGDAFGLPDAYMQRDASARAADADEDAGADTRPSTPDSHASSSLLDLDLRGSASDSDAHSPPSTLGDADTDTDRAGKPRMHARVRTWPKPATALGCRLCEVDSCDVPTATMCGHVFCKGCIEARVAETAQCPVCDQMLLLYCLFKLDV